MINGVKLVGRLKNDIEITKDEDGNEYIIMVLSIPRENSCTSSLSQS